jgi:hypothetical protein
MGHHQATLDSSWNACCLMMAHVAELVAAAENLCIVQG